MVAETREQAKDAAELIEVEYDDLPAVADTAGALAPGAAAGASRGAGQSRLRLALWRRGGGRGAFAKAARVVKLELINNRVICNAMEPRACVAEWDAGARQLTLQTGTQGVWMPPQHAGRSNLGLDPEQVRVTTPDVGGGFGMKAFFYPEYTMAAYAARSTGPAGASGPASAARASCPTRWAATT